MLFPVSENAVQRLVDRVERRLSELGEAEVGTDRVGDAVLRELSQIDVMAAARYASVFREFGTAADYDAFFAMLESEPGRDKPPGSGERG